MARLLRSLQLTRLLTGRAPARSPDEPTEPAILLESGGSLLLDTGGRILLESD